MHAEIARELALSGDPLALTLNGVRYVDKPPLLYALMAAAFTLVGPSEAIARAVPALAALAAVGATAWLGGRLLGLGGGFVAGAALLTSAGFFAYGRYVRPETLLVASLASGFALTLTGLAEDRRGLVFAGLLAFGMAGLAKDPLGALAPLVAVGLALALAGQARPLRRWLPLAGLAAALLLALGWWALAGIRTPGFVWYSVVDNHLLNVARARHFPDEDVPLSGVEFLIVAVLGASPWVLAAGASVVDLARRRAWRDPRELPWIALGLWAAGVLGLTALSPFRLPHYGLPAYPAIALLAARAWWTEGSHRLLAIHGVLFATVAAACALGYASDGTAFHTYVMGATDIATRKRAAAGVVSTLRDWDDLRLLLGLTALVFSAGAAAIGLLAARRTRRGAAMPTLAVVAVVATMLAALPAVATALTLVSSHRAVRPVALELARRAGAGDLLVHEGALENSGALEWYSSHRPVILDGRRSVLGFGAALDGASDVFWEPARLERAWRGDRRVWLVSTRAPAQSVVARLPGARLVLAAGGRRLYVNRDD